MAVFSITHEQRADGFGCVTLLTNAPLAIGQSVVLAGLNHGLNGTQIIADLANSLFLGVDQFGQFIYNPAVSIPNQVVFADAGNDVARVAVSPYGTLTTGVCQWIDDTDLADWLNIGQASTLDAAFLDDCAKASNQFCYRRRFEAGYVDSLTTVPDSSVKLGTVMYAGALYRARGSIDQFASFTDMGTAPTVGMSPIIKQLLGIDRPAVA